MEMEHGLVGDVGGFEDWDGKSHRPPEISPGRRPDHQGIEVDGKDPIDEAAVRAGRWR